MASNETGGASRVFTRFWFWALLLGSMWLFPLLKSLSVSYPDPVPGHERSAESYTLMEEGGELVSCAQLGGLIQLVQALDLSSSETAEADFASFRERKKRVRGLGSLIAHVVLVRGADREVLSALIDSKTARKPSNLFLLDPEGATMSALLASSGADQAEVFVLDRHGRIRGAYGSSEAEGNRFAQDIGALANWQGSDPELGAPVTR